MAISFVNGFLCTCSCDEIKAKRGENPHPDTNPRKADADRQNAAAKLGRLESPAVIFGGALSGTPPANRVTPVDSSQPADPAALFSQKPTVDVLA
jgi:hypothetical protein